VGRLGEDWLRRGKARATKLKGLRHWLRSSHRLLRGSQQRGDVHRPNPLMRSLLSQFQTPAPPRRVSRLFRVWQPDELPRRPNHSAYFGLATFLLKPTLSAVDGHKLNVTHVTVNAAIWCNVSPEGPRTARVKCVDGQVLRRRKKLSLLFCTGASTATLESSVNMNKEIH